MVFDTPEQEIAYANDLIAGYMEYQSKIIEQNLLAIKEAKKALRKFNKQVLCEHEFKLKQLSHSDHYKCKKCKFEFFSDPDKTPTVFNRILDPMKFDGLYNITEDDAPQAARE